MANYGLVDNLMRPQTQCHVLNHQTIDLLYYKVMLGLSNSFCNVITEHYYSNVFGFFFFFVKNMHLWLNFDAGMIFKYQLMPFLAIYAHYIGLYS